MERALWKTLLYKQDISIHLPVQKEKDFFAIFICIATSRSQSFSCQLNVNGGKQYSSTMTHWRSFLFVLEYCQEFSQMWILLNSEIFSLPWSEEVGSKEEGGSWDVVEDVYFLSTISYMQKFFNIGSLSGPNFACSLFGVLACHFCIKYPQYITFQYTRSVRRFTSYHKAAFNLCCQNSICRNTFSVSLTSQYQLATLN